MGIIQFSIRNSLVVNLFLLIVVIAGALAWTNLPQEMFPVVDLDRVRVTTEFEGAPPAEVEKQITLVIEEELESLPDIDLVTSESSEGMSKIEIQLKPDTDVDDFLIEVRALVDAINDLPEEAETATVSRLKTRFPVISLALYGDIPPGLLYATAEDVRRDILALPGVGSVGIAGDRDWELWIVVDQQHLAARAITLEQVQQSIRANLRDLPGGSVQSSEGDILLRGMGVANSVEAVERLVIQSEIGGGQLMLGEVAEVQLRLQEEQTLGRFNGAPSIDLTITKTAKASTIDIAAAVRTYTDEIRASLPLGIEVGLFSDLSVYVKTRLDTVKSSGLIGLILVLASLYWFLNFRVAFITALGIPVSFFIGVILMYYLGYTINMISLFAFLIALGMIVYDAIIVTENVYRHIENGVAPRQAARIG